MLTETARDKLRTAAAVLQAPGRHVSCLLIVATEIVRLEQAAAILAGEFQWSRRSIGFELSEALLPCPPLQRSRAASDWTEARLREMAPDPILCTELDLLFEPAIALDPLRLFANVSRYTRVALTWPGTYLDDVLTYAVPEHRHYRTWRHPGVEIVAL